jgi:hypothetical protein
MHQPTDRNPEECRLNDWEFLTVDRMTGLTDRWCERYALGGLIEAVRTGQSRAW